MLRSFTFVCLLVVCLVIVGPLAAQDAPTPEPVGLRPDAPHYALHGPYWVGTQEFVIDPDSARPIPLTVWYPALNPEGLEESTTYNWYMKWDGMPEMDYIVQGHALDKAQADLSGAPYPLVVFSHGFAMSGTGYSYLLEHLASYGFVVAAPEHEETYFGSDAEPWHELPSALAARPQDIVRVLDYADGLTAAAGPLEGMINTEQAAVAGHSAGSYTSLAAAGAHFDAEAFQEACASVAGAMEIVCDTLLAEPMDSQGIEARIENLWPSVSDPRIKAIIPMAGDGWSFGTAGLANLTVPMMAMAAMADSMAPYDTGLPLAFSNAPVSQKALVSFAYGDHFMFGAKCPDVSWLVDAGLGATCSGGTWTMDHAHDLINHFTTAFLLDTLYGDEAAHAALMPDSVDFRSVEYQAEGF